MTKTCARALRGVRRRTLHPLRQIADALDKRLADWGKRRRRGRRGGRSGKKGLPESGSGEEAARRQDLEATPDLVKWPPPCALVWAMILFEDHNVSATLSMRAEEVGTKLPPPS